MHQSNHNPVIVIAPDSFKGSLSAVEAAEAIASGIQKARPDAVMRLRPMADGGEGTVSAIVSVGGMRQEIEVHGAAGAVRSSCVALDDNYAVIEVAEIVGITDPIGVSAPVIARSSIGVGEVIASLLSAGVRSFYIGLGGSSTNDAGMGMLHALGAKFLIGSGDEIEPIPKSFSSIAAVDLSGLDPRAYESTFVCMSDVENPLCGEVGATAVFGPQKGVAPWQIVQLDADIKRVAALCEAAQGCQIAANPGAGAAGGLGFALQLIGAHISEGLKSLPYASGWKKPCTAPTG